MFLSLSIFCGIVWVFEKYFSPFFCLGQVLFITINTNYDDNDRIMEYFHIKEAEVSFLLGRLLTAFFFFFLCVCVCMHCCSWSIPIKHNCLMIELSS